MSTADLRRTRVWTGARSKLEELFGADVRSLAALRVALAVLLLLDLIGRSTDLVAFYTDVGVLPRSAFLEESGSRWLVSVHLASGTWQVQALLFLLAAVAALAMLVGYRTRLATAVSWFLFASVTTRNPGIVLGADLLLRIVLFWAMFLPLGACCSVDRALNESPARTAPKVLSLGTFTYQAQIVVVYWFGVLLKTGAEWRTEGTALYYALSSEHLTTPLGDFLLQFPALLKVLTFGVLWFEIIGPVLLFCPILTAPIRTATVVGFVLLHLGIGLTLRLGLFPAIAALSMTAFVPSWVWDRVCDCLRARRSPAGAHYHDRDSGFCARITEWMGTRLRHLAGSHYSLVHPRQHGETAPVASSPRAPEWRRGVSQLASVVLLLLFAYVMFWNVATLPGSWLKLSDRLRAIGDVLRLDQTWNMFAPYPLKDDGWYVIPGRLRDGDVVDVFRGGGAVSWDKPRPVSRIYRNARWRKYMVSMASGRDSRQAARYAAYLCRRWNQESASARGLEELEIVFVRRKPLPDYRPRETQRVSLLRHTCSDTSGR